MAEEPESKPIGNTDPSKRGRGSGDAPKEPQKGSPNPDDSRGR